MNVLKLDPEAVTAEALSWVAAMAERSGWELPELPRTEQAPQSAELRFRIHALCAYAQEGKRVDGPPGPHIAAVTEALYAPAYPHAPQYRHALDAEPATEVDALLRASLARERVEAGRSTPAGWLAVLAGVDLLQLPATYRNGDVPAAVAIRLLSGRGILAPPQPEGEDTRTTPGAEGWQITWTAVRNFASFTGQSEGDEAELRAQIRDEPCRFSRHADSGAEIWKTGKPLKLHFLVRGNTLERVLGSHAGAQAQRARKVTVWDESEGARREMQVTTEVREPNGRRIAYRLASGEWADGWRSRTRPDGIERMRTTRSRPSWVR